MTSWRDNARPLIARILKETEGKSEREIRKALRDGYPWGPRAMHPYKIWCDEVRRQRGRFLLGPRGGKLLSVPDDPKQMGLFDEGEGDE